MRRYLLALALFSICAFQALGAVKVSALTTKESVAPGQLPELAYKQVPDQTVNFLNSKGYVYIKIEISKSQSLSKQYFQIAYSLLDTVEYFYKAENGVERILTTGQMFAFDTRLLNSTDFVLPIKEGQTEYYLKITSTKPIVVPVNIYTKDQIVKSVTTNDFVFGAFIGIVLVMALYNLVVFLLTRDRSYIYYIIYLVALGLAQAALFGYTDRFLFPTDIYLNSRMAVMGGGLVGIASVFFIRDFLHLKEKAPIFDKLMLSVAVLDTFGIILLFSGMQTWAYNVINITAALGSVIAIVVALKLTRTGYKPAGFFLIAWSIFLLSVVIFALKDFNIIPYNPLFRRSMLFGSTIEIILLSVALADRINKLRKEKEESQAEALRMARENERIIKEQNIELEKRVEARTMELQEANEELQVTLDNLKDTQTQLVDAEKMASLGQLTAGIAHEINNPINFITSNIKPLKLDLSEVYQIVERFASLNENATEEELKEAKALLDELDYSYLKDEIESLVSGISDGANRTSEIVRGLRTFSRLDEDVVKPANLNEGLDSTLVLLKNKTKDTIEIVRDYQADLPDVECYPGKLNQAFMNILNNGIYAVMKKNHPEGEKPTLTLKTTEVDKDHVSLHLIDNGIGMDEQTRKKMFDPFFTTKEVGEGTGLGMSIVFKIVDKHGGKLDVKSEPGVGTEFIITLPKRQPNEFS